MQPQLRLHFLHRTAIGAPPCLRRCSCCVLRRGGRLCPSSFPVFTGIASFAETPQLCLRRPTFSVAPEKVGKKRRWIRIGLYRKPQNEPVEKHCSQHTEIFLQSYTTAPPAWNNAPIGSSCYARGWQNTLPWNAERIYVFADGAEYLRSIVNVCRDRCLHRPVEYSGNEQNRN